MKITLGTKVVLVISAALICCLIIVGGLALYVSEHGISQAESHLVTNHLSDVERAIQWELSALESFVFDWSVWNDTFYFIAKEATDYIESNLMESTFTNYQLNVMAYFDIDGRLIHSQGFDLSTDSYQPVDSRTIEQLQQVTALLRAKTDQTSKQGVSGILMLDGRPFLVASHLVFNSDGSSEPGGSLVVGRYLEGQALARIADISGKTSFLHALATDDHSIPVSLLAEEGNELVTTPLTSEIYAGYSLLEDLFGHPALVLEVNSPRDVRVIIQEYVGYFLWALLFSALVLFAGLLWYLRRDVLQRLTQIRQQIQGIKNLTDLSTSQVEVKGNDELAQLGEEFNQMLQALAASREELSNSEEAILRITENMLDVILLVGADARLRYVSPSCEDLLGYTQHDLMSRNVFDLLHPDDQQDVLDKVQDAIASGILGEFECRARHRDGSYLWIAATGKVQMQADQDGTCVLTCRDVTPRKVAENRVNYLSYHDRLTGLHNRVYFEERLEQLEQTHIVPVTIVLADINGLKMINDTFGHIQGNLLLKRVANTLKEECPPEAVVARWGGDEFAVILTGFDANQADTLCRRIKSRCEEYQTRAERITISCGFCSRQTSSASLYEVMQIAEERMYRNKLTERKSVRSSIVASLQNTLHEKTHETEEHAQRLQQLAVKLGKKLGLFSGELDEMAVLALLHDIGKVAIPDHILLKPGKLTSDEWEIMKTHPEIGFRIVGSSGELVSVADGILYHHERWDGSGYPRGLEGEQIPLSARIISIVDAYDVMTNERVYQKRARTKQEALQELKACAGTQFDPLLVDLFIEMMNDQE